MLYETIVGTSRQLPGVRLARRKENKPEQNPPPKPTKIPQQATKPKLNILYWLAACQEAAGAGCFPRADDTRGNSDREREAQAEISASQYLNKRSRSSPVTAARINQQPR